MELGKNISDLIDISIRISVWHSNAISLNTLVRISISDSVRNSVWNSVIVSVWNLEHLK